MKQQRFSDDFQTLLKSAVQLGRAVEADALLVLLEAPTDWPRLKRMAGNSKVIVAADTEEQIEGCDACELSRVILGMAASPVHEKLTQALLESVADDFLASGARVVAVYSGFEPGTVDSLSVIDLGEHFGRLTARDLQRLETSVPLDTLKTVVDLAVEIGRGGREGKPVGTLFVVGDSRKVLSYSHVAGFDPVRGYNRKERNLMDRRVREGIKEISQMDGAIIVSADGTVEAACRFINAPAAGITLSKGMGARHWTAAAISRVTKSIAVTVSETNGTVRVFQEGQVMLRIEPLQRALKWREFDYEPPQSE